MPASEHILILGGTREAAELAAKLVDQGCGVTTSLAGRTKHPSPLAGAVRIGGFGGITKMSEWITNNGVTRVIDATHPFATTISANALTACAKAGVRLTVNKRAPWEKHNKDIWIEVDTLDQAAGEVPANARVLLALGSQHLTPFFHQDDTHFTIRTADPPNHKLPFKNHQLIFGQPSAKWSEEAELLQGENISHIVCRNSGGKGSYAKIEAARHLAIPVIIVSMPK